MKYVRSLVLLATFAVSPAALGMKVIPVATIMSTGSSSASVPQSADEMLRKIIIHNM